MCYQLGNQNSHCRISNLDHHCHLSWTLTSSALLSFTYSYYTNGAPRLSRTFYFLDKMLGPGAGFTDNEFFRTINGG